MTGTDRFRCLGCGIEWEQPILPFHNADGERAGVDRMARFPDVGRTDPCKCGSFYALWLTYEE